MPFKSNKDEAYFVIEKLTNAGYYSVLAGGCVRDELFGLTPVDFDVATAAPPDVVIKLFDTTKDFAKRYGVVFVTFKKHKCVEVTTFRKDFRYVDGRHPQNIEFGDITDDFKRRDFTINAIYKDIYKNEFIDFCDGINDVKNKVLRCVNNADERIAEDRLRILRAIRFACALELTIEPQTFNAIKNNIQFLNNISVERIREELTKMLTHKNANKCLELLHELSALKIILPEIADCVGVAQPPQFHPEGDVFSHILKMFELADYPISKILAFAILFHDIGKPKCMTISDRIRFHNHETVGAELAETVMQRLKFSKKDIRDISYIIRNHMKFISVPMMRENTIRKFISSPTFETELQLHYLDCVSSHNKLEIFKYLTTLISELKIDNKKFISYNKFIENENNGNFTNN